MRPAGQGLLHGMGGGGLRHPSMPGRPHFLGGGLAHDPRAIAAALALARQRGLQPQQGPSPTAQAPQSRRASNGDVIHTGSLDAPVPGRTDHIPVTVPSGSYVIPADVVNHYGQDNSKAGHQIMEALFRSGAIKKIHAQPGVQPNKAHLPIAVAGGEYIVAPEAVAHIGNGDIKLGHRILDQFVKSSRAAHIKTLRKLPGPQK